jgi:hypothetical protein
VGQSVERAVRPASGYWACLGLFCAWTTLSEALVGKCASRWQVQGPGLSDPDNEHVISNIKRRPWMVMDAGQDQAVGGISITRGNITSLHLEIISIK